MIKMSLLDWIDIDKLDLYNLSLNPKSVKYLEKNPDIINWDALSLNHNAIKIL